MVLAHVLWAKWTYFVLFEGKSYVFLINLVGCGAKVQSFKIFFQTNIDFLTSHFWRNFLYHWKGIVVLSLNLKKYFTRDHFLLSYEGLKIAILAILTNLGQLTRDILRAINAEAEI